LSQILSNLKSTKRDLSINNKLIKVNWFDLVIFSLFTANSILDMATWQP